MCTLRRRPVGLVWRMVVWLVLLCGCQKGVDEWSGWGNRELVVLCGGDAYTACSTPPPSFSRMHIQFCPNTNLLQQESVSAGRSHDGVPRRTHQIAAPSCACEMPACVPGCCDPNLCTIFLQTKLPVLSSVLTNHAGWERVLYPCGAQIVSDKGAREYSCVCGPFIGPSLAFLLQRSSSQQAACVCRRPCGLWVHHQENQCF